MPAWYGEGVSDAMPAWTVRQILDSGAHIDALLNDIAAGDPRPALADLEVPVCLVHGRDDRAVPLHVAQELARLIPRAELVVVDEAGHMPQQEQPAAVTAAVRAFVRATSPVLR